MTLDPTITSSLILFLVGFSGAFLTGFMGGIDHLDVA